jgi:hypothetical protein
MLSIMPGPPTCLPIELDRSVLQPYRIIKRSDSTSGENPRMASSRRRLVALGLLLGSMSGDEPAPNSVTTQRRIRP